MSVVARRILGWLWPQSSKQAMAISAAEKPPVVVNRTDYLFPFVVPGSSEAILVDFSGAEDSAQREKNQWEAFGDGEIGGQSTYSFKLIRKGEEGKGNYEEPSANPSLLEPVGVPINNANDPMHNTENEVAKVTRRRKHDFYARFSGRLHFGDGTLTLENQKMARAGYCGIRKSLMTASESLCIQEYDILRLLVRGDGNIYNLNLRTDNYIMGDIPDYNYDLWQVPLHPKANRWVEIEVPWQAFKFTFKGKYIDEGFFDGRNIMSIGFSPFRTAMIEQGISDFRLDIAWIKAEVQPVEYRTR